jgi:hypothetical protein
VGKPYLPEQRQIDYLQGICYQKLGQVSNQEVSQKALQQYTLDHYQRGRPANILGLVSLKYSGRGAEAEAIVDQLEKKDNLASQWVVAQYNQDADAISDLSLKANQVDPTGYELLKRMLQYR